MSGCPLNTTAAVRHGTACAHAWQISGNSPYIQGCSQQPGANIGAGEHLGRGARFPCRLTCIILSVVLIVLSGCSKQPELISPAYTSPLEYQHLICPQIQTEIGRVRRSLDEFMAAHRKEASKDAAALTVGLILFAPAALFMLGGGDKKDEISRLKGEFNALEEIAIQKQCSDAIAEIDREREREAARKPQTDQTSRSGPPTYQ